MAIKRVWKPSPNYSGRGGSSVRMITVHTSEGATTNQSLANFITQASAQVSYHISVDNQAGEDLVFEYVQRDWKSWSQANYNPVAVTGCFCTPSGASSNWSRATWLNQSNALRRMAAWVKEEASRYNIPLVALTDAQAQGSGRGICQHRNLGAGGSNHHDCGSGFPMDELLRLASGGTTPSPEPPPVFVDWNENMGAISPNGLTVPVPEGTGSQKKFAVSADVGAQGGQPISVRLVFKYKSGDGWQVVNASLTEAKPVLQYSTNDRSAVGMTVTGNKIVGYSFW